MNVSCVTGSVIALVIAVIGGIFVAIFISKPLGLVSSLVGDLSELKIRKDKQLERLTKRKDEIGLIANSVDVFIEALRDTIENIQGQS